MGGCFEITTWATPRTSRPGPDGDMREGGGGDAVMPTRADASTISGSAASVVSFSFGSCFFAGAKCT